MNPFTIYPDFVPADQIEDVIRETYVFKNSFYNEENLERHSAYLSDVHPTRQSHAYATSLYYPGDLPYIDLVNVKLERLVELHRRAVTELGLTLQARTLFNVQEYFSESAPVPRHCDGELLDFTVDAQGGLDIKRSIRPEKVAVLTLVNDTDGNTGTRLHFEDGTSTMVQAKAGDLLVFDNINCFHSVDKLTGTVKRDDGLLRFIIGWRSLNENTWYMKDENLIPVPTDTADEIIRAWYHDVWPTQWENIKKSQQKAAF